MEIYIEGKALKGGSAVVPLSSAAIMFLLKYCDAQKDSSIILVEDGDSDKTLVTFPKDCLGDFKYDGDSDKTLVTFPKDCLGDFKYDGDSDKTLVTFPKDCLGDFKYDGDSDKTLVTFPKDCLGDFKYDGDSDKTLVTFPNDCLGDFKYDGDSDKTLVTFPKDCLGDFKYDGDSDKTLVTFPKDCLGDFKYDGDSDKTLVTFPNDCLGDFKYDGDSDKTLVTFPKDCLGDFKYDGDSDKTLVTFPKDCLGDFKYDGDSDKTLVTFPNDCLGDFKYDGDSDKTLVTFPNDCLGDFKYDGDSDKTLVTFPNDCLGDFKYDGDSDKTLVTFPNDCLGDFKYDGDSDKTLVTFPNDCLGDFKYDGDSDKTLVTFPNDCLGDFKYSSVKSSEVCEKVQNCTLPVVQDEGDVMIRSGLCSVVRHIVKYSSGQPDHKDDNYLDLLGFRAGSLKACSEVSGWTKLCEIELPDSISRLMQLFRSETALTELEIPADLMKLELHLEKPPLLHNDDKKKRELLKLIKKEAKCLNPDADNENDVVLQFFDCRTIQMTHGDMYYRVISKSEKEAKKFVSNETNTECKFGCTEDRLMKWCAKCNDREKLRQKEKRLQQIQNRVQDQNLVNGSANNKAETELGDINEVKTEESEVKSVDELVNFVKGLTLYDIAHEHVYAEGVAFTIADMMLYTYVYFLLESMKFECQALLQKLPYLHKWLKHVITLPRVLQTSFSCGFKMAALDSCLTTGTDLSGDLRFSIPDVSLDIEEDSNEISRRFKGKIRPLKSEISRVLAKVKKNGIDPNPGSHPLGNNVQVDWSSVPLAANPKIELPEKRVGRKCEQLENLATAVQAIAKPGDVIVDFCSGGGHLGIIIAYLLPDCKVYLVENNEESLKRAKKRVADLKLSNITLYQCNLDYFRGHFTIGTCLHACGVATDMVLQQCLDRKASFVICPCCYGSIQNTHLITYPRSQLYRQAELTDTDVIMLGHAADQTEEASQLQSQGRHCMNLVDTDRVSVAMEMGYTVTLCSLQPLTCTPKNNLLIGEAPT